MVGYEAAEPDLIVGTYTLGAVVTWADLLAHSDIQIFSRAQFDKPWRRDHSPWHTDYRELWAKEHLTSGGARLA
jgi:hypothetical protein